MSFVASGRIRRVAATIGPRCRRAVSPPFGENRPPIGLRAPCPQPPTRTVHLGVQNSRVAKRREPVERALTKLRTLVHRPLSNGEELVRTGEVPEDLRSEDFEAIGLRADEAAVLEEVRSLLPADLRFEYLKDLELKSVTWRFVCLAHLQRKGDLVAEFVAKHAREPMEHTCFFPVELLNVKEEAELYGVKLTPLDAVTPPSTVFGHDPGPTTGSIAAVACTGTDRGNMAERARAVAERALRLLRATFREEPWMPDRQLRFRLGPVWWFDDSVLAGWTSPAEEGWELELDEALVRHATSQQISTLPAEGRNEVEDRAERALEWFERGQLAVDPIVRLLFLFSALEAILGDRSEKLKGHALAVRRAMLSLLTSGGFRHPKSTYLLYDEARSYAIHGEAPREPSQREVDDFAWDVRRALNEFLEYARTEGFTKRAQVRKALDEHERRDSVVRGLLGDDPKVWRRYLEPPAGEPD
jgi:hypothetical protein